VPIQKPDYTFPEGEFQPSLFDIDLPINSQNLGERGEAEGGLSFDEIRRRERTAVSAFTERLREILLLPAEQRAAQGYEGVPAYYEVYLDLLDDQWPPRVAAYIAWASAPRQNRWPKTQDELAYLLGLTSDRQFTKWRKNNEAIDALISKLQLEPLLKHRADVIDALIQSATDPDYKSHQDRKLYLEITGDYIPSAKLDAILSRSAGDGVEGLSAEQLRQRAGKDANQG
jgi:hypothetical protein